MLFRGGLRFGWEFGYWIVFLVLFLVEDGGVWRDFERGENWGSEEIFKL